MGWWIPTSRFHFGNFEPYLMSKIIAENSASPNCLPLILVSLFKKKINYTQASESMWLPTLAQILFAYNPTQMWSQ